MELTVDERKLDASLRNFNTAVVEWIAAVKLSPKEGVKRQAGLLARALVDATPPKDTAKTKKSIAGKITAKFTSFGLNTSGRSLHLLEASKQDIESDVHWYAFFPTQVFGVQKSEEDLTSADLKKLLEVNRTHKLVEGGSGRINVGKRGKQTFFIWKKILTSEQGIKKLIAHIVRRVGRMKGSWGVSWEDCGKHGRALPSYVNKQVTGCRAHKTGYMTPLLEDPKGPQVVIANRAKGASAMKRSLDWFLGRALRQRALAIRADMQFAIQNPDKWRDREKSAELKRAFNNL